MRNPFFRLLLLAMALAAGTGCATVFRRSMVKVHVESDPTGAQAQIQASDPKPTPADIEVDRTSTSGVLVTKAGYNEHRGIVKKKINGGWLAADIVSCFWALCIPMLIDAISGAWMDVAPRYVAKLQPATASLLAAPSASTSAGPPPVASATPAPDAAASMSESERKATARAAYIEGVQLEEKNGCSAALPKFEVAQKMYSAPTHLVHIAHCQAATGKLVEAHENFETLARTPLEKNAPEVFHAAQEQAKKELAALTPRIPTLRVQLTPAPSSLRNLVVLVNGSPIPNEVVGIARPVNPGSYQVEARADGVSAAPVKVDVTEGTTKSVQLTLRK